MKLLWIGDSWFDYPQILGTGGGIPDHYDSIVGSESINIAHHGDGSEVTLSLRKRKELEANLPGTDLLFVSMGGDDIAGDEYCLWLYDNQGQGWEGAINVKRFSNKLEEIINNYKDVIQERDRLAPNCTIVCHCYDYPPANQLGVGVCGLGPWLQPSLAYCGWTDLSDQASIIQYSLILYKDMLKDFLSQVPKCIFLDTQGLLVPEDWGNELHPGRAGFDKLATLFASATSKL